MTDIQRLYSVLCADDEEWCMVAENGGKEDHTEAVVDWVECVSNFERYEIPVLRYNGNDASYEDYEEEPIPDDYHFSEAEAAAAKKTGRFESLGHAFYRA